MDDMHNPVPLKRDDLRCPHCGEYTYLSVAHYISRTKFFEPKYKCEQCKRQFFRKNPEAIVFRVLAAIGPILLLMSALTFKWYVVLGCCLLLLIVLLGNYYVKTLGYHAHPDGSPPSGRRISVKIDKTNSPKRMIKKHRIYDLAGYTKGKRGVIYAQCEYVHKEGAYFRIITQKGYNAPLGDNLCVITPNGDIAGVVDEETKPPDQPQQ